jgi:porin
MRIAVSLFAATAAAQTVTDPTKPAPSAAPADKPAEGPPSPFSFTAAYTADLLGDVSGGASTGGGYADVLKLSASYDGSQNGHDGLTALLSLEHTFGSGFTEHRVGGLQAISAAEALPGSIRLYEAWVQQGLFDGQAGVKAGLIDLNTTFDVQETAALFLNASNGIGPDIGDTGLNGPSDYPTPALALTGFYRPEESWTLQAGVFNGVAGDPAHRSDFVAVKLDGALIIGQVEKRFGDTARVEVGAWTYTNDFPSITRTDAQGRPDHASVDAGLYGLLEGRLMPPPGGIDGGLSGWLRAGVANGDINTAEDYLGGGLVYTGPFKDRDKDEVGFAIARAGLGAGARHVGALAGRDIGAAETDLEATYRYVLRDWLNVQPDLQYVIDPHGDRRLANAVVVGLRLAFTYSK